MESVSGHTVYGVRGPVDHADARRHCSPTLLLAWWTEDPDPEDFADTVDTTTGQATVESTEPPRVTADASPSRPRDDDTPFDPPAPGRW